MNIPGKSARTCTGGALEPEHLASHPYGPALCLGWHQRRAAKRPPIWNGRQAGQVFTRGSLIQQNQTSRLQEGQRFFYFIFKQNFCYKEDAAILQFFFKMSFLFPLQKEKCFCASHCPILCTTTLPAAIETLPQVFCWAPLMAGTPFLLLTITPALISGMFAYIS